METPGHSAISLTMNKYCHVSPALQREAAVRIDEALRGGTVINRALLVLVVEPDVAVLDRPDGTSHNPHAGAALPAAEALD
jgi:hypothetical protein